MSEDAAAERKAAQAARQAKLLAKSQERLAKITGAAPDGRIPNDASLGIPTRPKEPAMPKTMPTLVPGADDDDPAEIDLASEGVQRERAAAANVALSPFAAFGGAGADGLAGAGFPGMMGGNGTGAGGGEDMFAQMLAQMTGAAGAGTPGGPGGMFGGMAGPGGASAFGAAPPTSPFPPAPKTFLDRVFPLIHFMSMVGLAVYAVMYLEPIRRGGLYGFGGPGSSVDWRAWGSLTSQKPVTTLNKLGQVIGFGIAEVPLLWMFVSIELVLQTTRLFLVRNRAQTPGILNSILPVISQFSPQVALAIQTGVRYFALVSVLLTDLSVLIFCVGLFIIVGKWKTGGHAVLIQEAGEAWQHLKEDL